MPRMTTTSYPSKSIRTRSTEWSRQVASSASKVVTGTRISVVFQGTGLKQCQFDFSEICIGTVPFWSPMAT